MIKKALIAFIAVMGVAGVTVGGTFLWGKKQYESPSLLKEDITIQVEKGMGLVAVSQLLHEKGIISDPLIVKVAVRLKEQHRSLKAGEYYLQAGISPEAAIHKIVSHDIVTHDITIPEGLTVREIREILENDDRFSGDFSHQLVEGQLLPETYQFVRNDERDVVVGRMVQAMDRLREELWSKRSKDTPVETWEEAVILASIVEKETGIGGERAKVASVFANRLAINMPLQSDPTVIYALTEGKKPLGRALLRKDWRFEHPYNTYRNRGLPPGPIATPGRAAIEAVLNPLSTDYFYFVANGTGGHSFAKTLQEHNRNVAKWRKFKRENNSNG